MANSQTENDINHAFWNYYYTGRESIRVMSSFMKKYHGDIGLYTHHFHYLRIGDSRKVIETRLSDIKLLL